MPSDEPYFEVTLPAERLSELHEGAVRDLRPGSDPKALALNGNTPIALFPMADYGTTTIWSKPKLSQYDITPPPPKFDVNWLMDEFAVHEGDIGQYEPHRNVVCWRITRELLRHWKKMAENVPLEVGMAPESGKNPWYFEQEQNPRRTTVNKYYWQAYELLKSEPHVAFDPVDAEFVRLKGLAYQPPGIHETLINADTMTVDIDRYDPHQDKLLYLWIKTVEVVMRDLNIEAGSVIAPDYGHKGSIALTNPYYARFVWPSPANIIATENILIEEVKRELVHGGNQQATDHMIKRWGFNRREISGLISMAHAVLKQESAMDKETSKALARARFEDLLARSKTAQDLRTELMILKSITILEGLGRTSEEQSGASAFLEAMNSIAEERETLDITPDFAALEHKTLPPTEKVS